MNPKVVSNRDNFKSPVTIRDKELILSKNQNNTRSNISAWRTSRRTRKDRVDNPEEVKGLIQKPNQYDDWNIPINFFESIPEFSNSLTEEMLEIEVPMPVPVPEKPFSEPISDKGFKELNIKTSRNNYRQERFQLPTVEEEESDWNLMDDLDSSRWTLPQVVERQSITNSQVFRMSDAEFHNFDVKQEITEFIEIAHDESPQNFDDFKYDTEDNIFERAQL